MQNFVKRAFSFPVAAFLMSSCEGSQDRIAAAEVYDEGKYAEAVTLANQAAAGQSPLLNLDDPRTFRRPHEVSDFLPTADTIQEAIFQNRIDLETSTRVLGENHENSLFAQLNLASVLKEVVNSTGDIDKSSGLEAESLCRRVLVIAEMDYGPDSMVAMRARQTLASVLQKRSQQNILLLEAHETGE